MLVIEFPKVLKKIENITVYHRLV